MEGFGKIIKSSFQREIDIGVVVYALILLFGSVRQKDSDFDIVSLEYRVRPQERGRKEGGKTRKMEGGRGEGGMEGGRRVEQEHTHAS